MALDNLRLDTGLPKGSENMRQATQQRLKILWESQMHNPGAAVRHEETHVLVLSWAEEDDDLNTRKEVDLLKNVFKHKYGFNVYHTLLRASQGSLLALRDMADFVLKHNKKNALLIIYYAGHGFGDKDLAPGNIKLSGKSPKPNGTPPPSEIIWSTLETPIIQATNADVFLIFDCCAAGRLCRPLKKRGPVWSTQYQFLGACSADQTTPGPGDTSFTTALIWALEELAKQDDHFTTFRLLRQIMEAPNFPDEQYPHLSERESRDTIGNIIICRKGLAPEMPRLHPTISEKEISKDRTYLDLRFVFENELEDGILQHTAQALRDLRDSSPGKDLGISRITFKSKYTATEHAVMRWKDAARKGATETTPLPESGTQAADDALGAMSSVTSQHAQLQLEQQHLESTLSEPGDSLGIHVPTVAPHTTNVDPLQSTDMNNHDNPHLRPSTTLAEMNSTDAPAGASDRDIGRTDEAGAGRPISLTSTAVEHHSGKALIRENMIVIRQSLKHILRAMFSGKSRPVAFGTKGKPCALEGKGVIKSQPSRAAT